VQDKLSDAALFVLLARENEPDGDLIVPLQAIDWVAER
jgi:hypothetical protein